MDNSKALGADELPEKQLKAGLHHDPTVLRELHQVITQVYREEKVP